MTFRWYGLLVVALLTLGFVPAVQAQEEEVPVETMKAPTSDTPSSKESDAARTRDQLRRAVASNPQLELPGAVDPEQYRVGPGDILQVSVWGGLSRNMTIEVGPEGTVQLPTAGTMKIDGMLLKQVRSEIIARLRSEFRGLSIDVRLLRPRRFVAYVTGQVEAPGSVPASGASRVADIVLLTEPLKNASLRNIEVIHRDGTREVADLELFLRTASQSLNPWVRDGDVLNVGSASKWVHVQGAVSRPGRYELGPNDSLRTLLQLGGGTVPAADLSRALLVRWLDSVRSESTWVNVEEVRAGSFNPRLSNGDRFYVYFIPQYEVLNEATVLGEVMRPGIYPIQEGRDRITDVVRAAGGFLPGADLASIRVRRENRRVQEDSELERLLRLSRRDLTNSEYEVLQTKLAGRRTEYRIDWARVQREPDLDLLLLGGDIIQVDRVINSIRVDGQVRRPGILAYRPGLGLEDYVKASGGFSERAWRNKIRVTRSVTGQTFLAKDVSQLDPGDLIWVPEKADVTFWDQTRTVLTAAAQVATVILAFNSVNR